jgi:hypothetical protein
LGEWRWSNAVSAVLAGLADAVVGGGLALAVAFRR